MIKFLIKAFYNTFFSNADVIIPNLWVGSYRAALDKNFIIDNNIKIIINCTENIPFIDVSLDDNLHDLELIRIPVNDSLLEKDLLLMEDYFKVILPYLNKKYVNEKKAILIHCKEGKQRSAIITASFIKLLLDEKKIQLLESNKNNQLVKKKSNLDQFKMIVKYMLNQRPQVFTYGYRINFEKTYKRYFNIK